MAHDDAVLKPGDRVCVDDEGLAQLRAIMEKYEGTAKPNHHGTVESILLAEEGVTEETLVYINFDTDEGEAIGNCAPYPLSEVHPL